MAISNTNKRKIPPTHPGEMLRDDFMPDFNLNATSMAAALGVSRQTINELLRERRSITPVMALRLSRLFENSPEFSIERKSGRSVLFVINRTQMTRILQIFTDFILFYLYLRRSVLICVIRVPLNPEPRTNHTR